MSAEILPRTTLHEMALRARLGLPVDAELVEVLCDAAEDLLDKVAEVESDTNPDFAQAQTTLARVEEERGEAVKAQAEAEEQVNEKQQEIDKLTAEKGELEGKLEELRVDARELDELRREVDDQAARIVQLEAQAQRALAWWKRRAEGELGADLATEQRARLAVEKARDAAQTEAARLLGILRGIAAGPADDAHRLARIAVGRAVLEETGTAASEGYIPTRRERKRARAGR